MSVKNAPAIWGGARFYERSIGGTDRVKGLFRIYSPERWSITKGLPQTEKYYKRALKAAPNHPDALHLAGLVAHQLGRQPRAIKLINKAIKKDCNQKVFYTNLSAIHNHLSNWEDARAAASSAVKLDEADGEAWGQFGTGLSRVGRD